MIGTPSSVGTGRGRPPPRRAPMRRTAGWFAVLLTAALLSTSLTVAATARTPSTALPGTHAWVHTAGPGFGVWNNGVLALDFPTLGPSPTVSAVTDARVSTSLRLMGVAEVSPQGNFTAFASFAPATTNWTLTYWHMTNLSTGETLILQFLTTTTVSQAQGVWESGDDGGDLNESLGNATFRVNISLNETYNGTGPAAFNAARVAVRTSQWPWQNSSDALGLDMAMLAPHFTRIAPTVGPTPYLLQELANGTNATVAALTWAPAATVLYSNGSSSSSSVATYAATAPTGANSTVRVLFGAVDGGYSSVSYDPWIALNLGAFVLEHLPAWAIDLGGWIALVAAVVISAVLAVGAARRRRQGPDEL